jgi:hypothetical protein
MRAGDILAKPGALLLLLGVLALLLFFAVLDFFGLGVRGVEA